MEQHVYQIKASRLRLTADVIEYILAHGRLSCAVRADHEERFLDEYEKLTGERPGGYQLYEDKWGISLTVALPVDAPQYVLDQLACAGSPVVSDGSFNGNANVWKLIELGLRVTTNETRYDAQNVRAATQRDIRVRKNGGTQ